MVTYNNNNYDGFFLWINASNGDTLMAIALIRRLLEAYPEHKYILGCWRNHAYLANHLPIHVFTFQPPEEGTNYYFDSFTPIKYIGFNCQLGILYKNKENNNFFHWRNMILTWNYHLGPLKQALPYKELEVILPTIDVSVNDNSIFVENGPSYSGHNDFYYDIDMISKKFPEITFYCTHNPNTSNHNVVDLSQQNMIYLQNVIKRCKAYIGKGSGPFLLTCNNLTKNMPKALFGFKLKEFGTLWADDFPVEYFEGDNDLVINYIKNIK